MSPLSRIGKMFLSGWFCPIVSSIVPIMLWCRNDYDRELANPPDKPFKATPFTYINRAYMRLFATEEDRALEELIKKRREETAAFEKRKQRIAALEKRINQLEQAEVAPSKLTHGAALAGFFQKK